MELKDVRMRDEGCEIYGCRAEGCELRDVRKRDID